MLGSRPLSRTTAFAPRRDLRREKPFHQERPALFVASPNHNPRLPILSISYLSRFPPPCPAFRLRFPPPNLSAPACTHSSPVAVRGMPEVPIGPPATGPPEGWAAVGLVSPASFNRGLWARLLRVLGS